MHNLLPQLPPAVAPARGLAAIGEKRARVGLFTGCVSEAMFSPTNRATALKYYSRTVCEVSSSSNSIMLRSDSLSRWGITTGD
ncbi:MAG: hypothetical protein R3C11_05700 [Planctomycetaceae bacterium]